MVSRPFSAFEKESLEIAGRLGRRPGSRSRYEADLRQWHASEMARSRSHDVILYATQYAVTASAQLWSKEFWDFLGSRHTMKGKRLLFFQSLSRTTTPSACSLSLSPRRRKGGVHTGRWRWTAGVSLKARRHQLLRRQRPAPGQVMLHQQQLEQAASFFACLSMTSTQDRTTTYRVTTCATATRLSLVVWHVWRFLVRYNNRGRRRRVDQNDRSFLSFFFHFLSKNSAETWNNRSPRSKEHFGAKKLEIYLCQRSGFWSVHACLKSNCLGKCKIGKT